MDGLPIELAKLCHLASMAECGDYMRENIPALGAWAALWLPFKARWSDRRSPVGSVLAPSGGQLLKA
jgi:hypothetical protein